MAGRWVTELSGDMRDTAGCAVTPIRPIRRVGHHLPKVTVGTWCGLASELGFPL